ncbi:MAG: hypothetical protein AABZ55_09890 [Bdellovibrionota bacterium]
MGKLIGSFLVEKGLISEEQIPLILKFAEDHQLRFGEAAAELKLFPIENSLRFSVPTTNTIFLISTPIIFRSQRKTPSR